MADITKGWKRSANAMIKRLVKEGYNETMLDGYLIYSKDNSILRINSEVLF